MMEDRWLILRFNRGEKAALHRLYDKYKDDLVTLAAALLLDVSAAEDVVHDVFVGFIGTTGRFRLTGSLKGYFLTCVANRARNHNKAGRGRLGPDWQDVPRATAETAEPDRAVIFSEQFGRLSQALQQLPYEQREVLLLRCHGQMRFAAIAKAQGVSINTVQGRYRYAIEKLRTLLDCEADQ